jgi:hypothetical protein
MSGLPLGGQPFGTSLPSASPDVGAGEGVGMSWAGADDTVPFNFEESEDLGDLHLMMRGADSGGLDSTSVGGDNFDMGSVGLGDNHWIDAEL